MKKKTLCPTVVIFILLGFCTYACHPAGGGRGPEYLEVTKVVDGDTFWVDDGTEKGLKIRLIGVDAPETRRTGRKDVGFYGKEASAYLGHLLEGRRVRLEYDVDLKDRYGRTLAYAYLEDGTFINADLLRKGYAVVLTVPPNVRFVEEFLRYQREAREQRQGLWALSE